MDIPFNPPEGFIESRETDPALITDADVLATFPDKGVCTVITGELLNRTLTEQNVTLRTLKKGA